MGVKHGNPTRPTGRTLIAWLLHQLGLAHHQADCVIPARITHYHSQKRARTVSPAEPTIRRNGPDATAE